MLYDKRWAKPEVKTDPFSLESLIAWLERQPAKKTYCYLDNGTCLLAQYYLASGFSQVRIGGQHVTLDGYEQEMPDDFSDIPVGHPRTFGGALRRARRVLTRRQ